MSRTPRDSASAAAANANSAAAPPPFETSLERLEGIVAKLENGNLPLAEALAAFEEGVQLSRRLRDELADAERRVEKLLEDGSQQPFDGDEDA